MELKSVLHLYIGCKIQSHPHFIPNKREKTEVPGVCILTPDLLADLLNEIFPGSIGYTWKPIIRKLESITEEEIYDFVKLIEPIVCDAYLSCCDILFSYYRGGERHDSCFNLLWCDPSQFAFLLSKGFDLFGLIDSGQAIDEAALNNEEK